MERTYERPGTNREILKVSDESGGSDYNFMAVQVLEVSRLENALRADDTDETGRSPRERHTVLQLGPRDGVAKAQAQVLGPVENGKASGRF